MEGWTLPLANPPTFQNITDSENQNPLGIDSAPFFLQPRLMEPGAHFGHFFIQHIWMAI